MIINRNTKLIASFIALALYANLASFTGKSSSYTESYPAVICPVNGDGESSFISLESSKVPVRKSGTSTMEFKEAGNSRLPGSTQALIINSEEATPITWQARSGVWAGALTCITPVTSQWFVGGTADVTSKGKLTLVNSGLGRAIVSLTIYTEKGIQGEQSVGVRANSFKSFSLASLAPGASKIAIHITPQSGRVNGFLIDERGRGLRSLGGDTVNSVELAAKEIVIAGIPHTVSRNKALGHTLRILVPGEVPATLSATLTTSDGTFAPAGIDGKNIPAGTVVELPLNLVSGTGKFALTLKADRPIVASVRSQTLVGGKSDFLWNTPVPELVPSRYSVTGAAPLLVVTGEKISVDIELGSPKGKVRKIELRGSGVLTQQIGEKVRTITVTSTSDKTYGALLISSQSGYGFAPLTPGSILTKSSIPSSNIRVLIP